MHKSTLKLLRHYLLLIFLSLSVLPSTAFSADVIILGNTRLKPVADVVSGINETLDHDNIIMAADELKEDIRDVVRENDAKAVIALGKGAVNIAMSLPESIPVVYGLVIEPLETKRRNITGTYMATPVDKYVSFIQKNFPEIKKVGIVCKDSTQKIQDRFNKSVNIIYCNANNPYEFIKGIHSFNGNVDALLLLPERGLITSKVLEELYLFSFRQKVPVIGISEKYVKTGSLFSFGFDTIEMGKQIGDLTKKVLRKGNAADIPPSPPENFKLYINTKTSRTMNVDVPEKLLETAEKVYP